MSKLNDLFTQLEGLVTETKTFVEKFDQKGVNSAGTKTRVMLQSVKVKAQEIRIEIGEMKKMKK